MSFKWKDKEIWEIYWIYSFLGLDHSFLHILILHWSIEIWAMYGGCQDYLNLCKHPWKVLLCIVWQFDIGSLPKWDRILIRRIQEILKQIWELTFELGVLTGTDLSVWQLSIISLTVTEKTKASSDFGWAGSVQDLFLQSHSSSVVLFWLRSKNARAIFHCFRNLIATSVFDERFLPNLVEISKNIWHDWHIVKPEKKNQL